MTVITRRHFLTGTVAIAVAIGLPIESILGKPVVARHVREINYSIHKQAWLVCDTFALEGRDGEWFAPYYVTQEHLDKLGQTPEEYAAQTFRMPEFFAGVNV